MRALAGFPPTGGSYFIPRAQLNVPEDFVKHVFPQAHELLEEVKSRTGEEQDLAAAKRQVTEMETDVTILRPLQDAQILEILITAFVNALQSVNLNVRQMQNELVS
ncbi:hypothetical protein HK102_013503 [Quaeritorhiza haematococci]|nr:hypothetical protein HK102_013503 [Quaeritorhiza haematococci]